MNRQDLFEHLLGSLHAAALDDTRWPETSALLDAMCEAKGNILVFGDGASRDDIDIFFSRAFYRGQPRPEIEREYFEIYHPMDERMPRLRQLPDGLIVHVDELYTEEEKKVSAAYNWLPTADSRNCLHVRLDGPDGTRIVWTVADPVDAEGWSSAHIGRIRRLLPHLRQFVQLRHALGDARAYGSTVAGLLESWRTGVIQLDRRGRVMAANDLARAFLRERDGLRDEDGCLRAALCEEDERLQRLVARAVPYPDGPGAGGSMTVSRGRSVTKLRLHLSPVGAEEPGRLGALVLVVDPASRLRLDPAALGALLGLTPAESYVAASLVEGKSAEGIAAETGRSTTTVKWHIRQIFAKRRLSGQADLVRLAMSLADTPGLRR